MTARTETTTTQPEGAAAPAATEAIGSTASLLADLRGSDRSEGAIPVTKHRRRLSGLSIITLFVIASSAAALWGMRYYGTRAGMKLDKISFELTPEADDTLAKTNHQQLLQALARSGMTADLAGSPVDKNPFYLTDGTDAALPIDPADDPSGRAAALLADAQARRAQEIRSALDGLVLHSIVGGAVPVANINDETVTIGDPVGDFFTVNAIQGRDVELEADG